MRKYLGIAGLVGIFLLTACQGDNQVNVASVFGDHMVLQANAPVNIWGSGTPNGKVQVKFRNQVKNGKIGSDGLWQIVLDPEEYGGPDSLLVISKSARISIQDILVGEVWICSGQSNMEMPLISNWATLNNAEQEVQNASYPDLRLFTVQNRMAFQPLDTVVTEGWMECNPESVKDFSATAYFFGREIHRELGVPVGLIHTSWGGTVAEAWTSSVSLLDFADFAEKVKLILKQSDSSDSLRAKYEKDMQKVNLEIAMLDAGIQGEDTVFVTKKVDTSDWLSVDLPKMWEETSLGVFDGSAWFIKEVNLSSSMVENELTLCYGSPDDWDEAWLNGVKVGTSRDWDVPRAYKIPKGVAREGSNTIVIRIMDGQGGGGFMNEAKHFAIKASNGQSIPISENWKAKKGFDFDDVKTIPVSPFNPNQPTVLFNAMINPIIPYTMKGVIWYQGESNAGRAFQYRRLFTTMIEDWRRAWDQGDFPFLFVQLANYLRRNDQPVEDSWAELREAQTMALQLPNTGMAVAIDIGNALDIHPGNKQDVGKRLALNALARVYNRDIPFGGPMYKSMEIKGQLVELSFDYVLNGLASSDSGPLKGFTISGSDGRFVWAEAEIVNEKVIVTSSQISEPAAVRYGWASNPECNLVNSAALPASPFRTDQFKGITEPE